MANIENKLSPKKDLSWAGLPEFVDDTVTDYSRPSPTVRSDKVKEGVRYTAIPPPAADLYLSPKKDLSWTVKTQYRALWVPTVNKNNHPVNRKFSTGRRNFPTANRKFPTASRKFATCSTKNHTADMGRKGKT
nr:hypothetical protein [Tanacetum cinerariifolium]